MKYLRNFSLLALSLAIFISGCSMFKPVPNDFTVAINTSADLNPDADGRSSPVVLRIYELNSVGAFNEKDFFALYDNDKETLGNALVNKQEMEFNPNESRKIAFVLNDKTKHLGFMAAYRDIDNATWRESIALDDRTPTGVPLYKSRGLTVDLGKNKISLTSN